MRLVGETIAIHRVAAIESLVEQTSKGFDTWVA